MIIKIEKNFIKYILKSNYDNLDKPIPALDEGLKLGNDNENNEFYKCIICIS